MSKKKILIQTDNAVAKTGFGRTAKALLTYLYKTGKYDIVHYSLGIQKSHPSTHRTPWKTIGCLPDNQVEMQQINRDPSYSRQVNYGSLYLDEVIKEEKPDVYFAMQDIWGVDYAVDKDWFGKITSVIWTTLDSLPILPTAIEKANKIKNYWVWSNFATKELHRLGHEHVKTVHGPVECSSFKKLKDQEKINLRLQFQQYIPMDSFVVGFVFRNQLRKSVPNLMEGFSIFKKRIGNKNAKLLLHTSLDEGWDIFKMAKEYNVDEKDILITYVCKECKKYAVANFLGQKQNCPYCSSKGSLNTTSVSCGVSEEHLNEIYNLMDVYVHPFTSGGQEIPIQEAKLAELITCVTNYSCGEEMCEDKANSLPLDWNEYREHQTHFKKANTCPRSIAKQLKKVYDMKPDKRKKMASAGRQWVLSNFSINSVGKEIEKFIDEAPKIDYTNINLEGEEKDPDAIVPKENDPVVWIKSLYKNILKMDVDNSDAGLKYWLKELDNGVEKDKVDSYFRRVALQENNKGADKELDNLLDKDDKGHRILYVMPQSMGDVMMSTSLFKSIKEQYPEHNLYVATKPEFIEVLDGNPYVHGVIPYQTYMDSLLYLEGQGEHNGWFEVAFLPHVNTQKILTYTHNGKDKIAYKDLAYEQ